MKLIVTMLLMFLFFDMQAVTRSETMKIADSYTRLKWTMKDSNRRGSCPSVYTSRHSVGQQIGMAYKFAGWDTLSGFLSGISDGMGAGSTRSDYYDRGIFTCVVGADCSGFVSRAWKMYPRKYTRSMYEVSYEIDVSDMKKGDALNKAGSHMVLLAYFHRDGSPVIMETTQSDALYRSVFRKTTWSRLSGFKPIRYDYIEDDAAVSGDVNNPIVIRSFPFTSEGNTRNVVSLQFDSYPTASDKYYGPEVVYELRLSQSGTVSATLTDFKSEGIDNDLHLVPDLGRDSYYSVRDSFASGDTSLEYSLEAGTYYLIVDSFSQNGIDYPGEYTLKVNFTPGEVTGTPDKGEPSEPTEPTEPVPIAGALETPIEIKGFPFADQNTTAQDRISAIRNYSISPTAMQEGPEVSYVINLPSSGRLTATVSGDNYTTVDNDINFLSSLSIDSRGMAVDSLARDDRTISADLSAGTYYLTVDAFSRSGVDYRGAYKLDVSFEPVAEEGKDATFSDSAVLNRGTWKHYGPFDALSGDFTAAITGPSPGDVDLYVRKDAQPTSSLWDCRPWRYNSNETCVQAGPGKFYVSVEAPYATDRPETSSYELKVDYMTKIEEPPEGACGDGILGAGEVCDSDQKQCSEINASYTSGTASCKADCTGYDTSGCVAGETTEPGEPPAEGEPVPITIGAFPFETSGTTDLSAESYFDSYSTAPTKILGGVEVIYTFSVQQRGTVVFSMTGDSSGVVDNDIHLLSSLARNDSKQAVDTLVRNDKLIEYSVEPGTYYISVDAYTDGGKVLKGPFRLSASFSASTAERDLVLADSSTVYAGQWRYYGPFSVSKGDFTAEIFGDAPDADIYVKRGDLPTEESWDCRPWRQGTNETCTLSGTGNYYVAITGYPESTKYTLTVSYRINESEYSPVCGNGMVETGEVCDGEKPCSSVDSSYVTGDAPCMDNCSRFDTSSCVGSTDVETGKGIPGTVANPVAVTAFPFTQSNSTAIDRESYFDSYSARPEKGELGPEVIYALTLTQAGTLRAEISGDTSGKVDNDIHLLSSLMRNDAKMALDTLVRDDKAIEMSLNPGTFYISVDAYSRSGLVFPGAYDIEITFAPKGGSTAQEITVEYADTVYAGQWIEYGPYDAVEGAFRANMTGADPDADIYVRKGAKPDADNWDCRPWRQGTNELCELDGPGSFYVGITGYPPETAYRLTITYMGAGGTEIVCGNGVVEGAEVCDGDLPCSEYDERYLSGTAVCKGDCSGFDLSGCVLKEKGAGTPGDPIAVTSPLFVDENSTAASTSMVIDTYSCKSWAIEGGPEVVYVLNIDKRSTVSAEITDDRTQGIDNDIHLLSSLRINDSAMALDCIVRHDRSISRDLDPGTYYIVVDAYGGGGNDRRGAYKLTVSQEPLQ